MELPDIMQFIRNEMLNNNTYVQALLPMGITYIRYNLGETVEKVGFCFNRDELVSSGVYIGGKLNGLGMRMEKNIKLEGMFFGDQLNGMGVIHNLQQYRVKFGWYDHGQIKEEITN